MGRFSSAACALSLLLCLFVKVHSSELCIIAYAPMVVLPSLVAGGVVYIIHKCCPRRHPSEDILGQRLRRLEEKSDVELRVMGGILLSAQGKRAVERYFRTIIPTDEDRDVLIEGAFKDHRPFLREILDRK